jgi:hypothetical protein
MNLPGPNRDVYATVTLSICIFTTVVFGGLTDKILTHFGMKQHADDDDDNGSGDGLQLNRLTFTPSPERIQRRPTLATKTSEQVYRGAKKLWKQLDDDVLIPYFGGPTSVQTGHHLTLSHRGNYELSNIRDSYSDDGEDHGYSDD